MGTILLTIIALATVVLAPGLLGMSTGMKLQRGSRMMQASAVSAVVALLWAVYWKFIANPVHDKHAVLFVALAVVAVVGASFSRPQTV